MMKELIVDVKKKQELRNLDDVFVEKKILEFLRYPSRLQEKQKAITKLDSAKTYKLFSKSKEHDFLIKSVRAELRKIYGVFVKDVKLSQDIDNNSGDYDFEKLLSSHQSTREIAIL